MVQDPLAGQLLGGARLQQRVSKGLLADVYMGQYERLGVPVAVKILSPKAMAQGVNKDRFVREGRALAQMQHPNIIKIYNVGHEHGRLFIIMDWIQDGMNLRQLAQSRPLTPAQSLKVIQRMCDALDYIHQRNLIHRDIKPANVCLRRGGHPVLMDFSLIKDQSSDVQLTAPGTIMGTVNFMPPEQAQPGGAFGDVSPCSDVYSLGGALYWLLTGKPPFKGRTPMETIIKLMREQPVAPSQYNPSLPPVVDQLVLATLAKKQADRPQTARELASRIEALFQQNRAELEQAQRPALAEADSGRNKKPLPQPPQQPQPQHARANSPAPNQQPGMPGAPGAGWGRATTPSPDAMPPGHQQPHQAPGQQQPHQQPGQQQPQHGGPQHPQPGQAAPGQMQPAAHQPGPDMQPMQPAGMPMQPAATATAEPPQSDELGAGPTGFEDAAPEPEMAASPFSPSFSTESSAAGLLKAPDLPPPAEDAGKSGPPVLLVVFLLLVIAGGVGVAVWVFLLNGQLPLP
jgi:serine/threonine protein kinase